MALFERLRKAIRQNINDLIQKSDDPTESLDRLIVDMNNQMVDAKRQVATAMADEKRLHRQVENHERLMKEWDDRAMTALQAGKEQLAKEALVRREREKGYHDQLKQQWEQQHQAVEQLKVAMRGLQDKLDEARRKKNLLVTRAKRAEAQRKIQEVMTGLSDTSAFDQFEEMSEKIERMEAENEALLELDSMTQEQDIEKQFQELEQPDTDRLLADLKTRMGLPGSDNTGDTGSDSSASGAQHGAGSHDDGDYTVSESTSDEDLSEAQTDDLKRFIDNDEDVN